MNNKTVFVAVAMLLSIGSANAEITTLVKSVTGDKVEVPKDIECFVKERTLFGNGGASIMSPYFADGGLVISSNKKADCSIVVGGTVTLLLNKENPSSVAPILAEHLINDPYFGSDVDAAIQMGESTNQFASTSTEADKPKSALGETAGAAVGATFGLAGAAGGAMLGALFDDKKKQMPVGVASIYADLKFKDANGKVSKMDVVVHAASTTKERPADLLRAAVKRVVAEIQAKQDASTNASASTSITTKEIH